MQGESCLQRPWSSELDLLRPGAGYEQKPKTGLLMNQSPGAPSKRQGRCPLSCPPGRACPFLLPPQAACASPACFQLQGQQAEQPARRLPAWVPTLVAVSRQQLLPMLVEGPGGTQQGAEELARAMPEILFKTTGRVNWLENIPSWRHCSSASSSQPATSFLCVSYTC